MHTTNIVEAAEASNHLKHGEKEEKASQYCIHSFLRSLTGLQSGFNFFKILFLKFFTYAEERQDPYRMIHLFIES